MGRLIPIKFGPRKTDVDVEGKKYSELPGILATIHDTEVPDNVEMYANEKPVDSMNDPIPGNVRAIEITAVAGQKQK